MDHPYIYMIQYSTGIEYIRSVDVWRFAQEAQRSHEQLFFKSEKCLDGSKPQSLSVNLDSG